MCSSQLFTCFSVNIACLIIFFVRFHHVRHVSVSFLYGISVNDCHFSAYVRHFIVVCVVSPLYLRVFIVNVSCFSFIFNTLDVPPRHFCMFLVPLATVFIHGLRSYEISRNVYVCYGRRAGEYKHDVTIIFSSVGDWTSYCSLR